VSGTRAFSSKHFGSWAWCSFSMWIQKTGIADLGIGPMAEPMTGFLRR
jgi:hypothetical protein